MKRFGKLLSLLLAVALLLPAVTALADESYPEITFCMIQFDPFPSDDGIQQVQDAINAITEPKIGVHVNLQYFTTADYQTNIVLRHASGEPCDVFVESVVDAVSAGRAADITEPLAQYATAAIEAIGEESYKTCIIDGRCYGLPSNKDVTIGTDLLYRKDLFEQAGIEVGELNSLSDLTPIFAKLHEAYPEIYPIYIMGGNMPPFIFSMKNAGLDFLSESGTFNVSGACLIGDESQQNLKVVNLYESPYFLEAAKAVREWYQSGYISPDAVTAADGNDAALKSGKYACCFVNGCQDQGASQTNTTGYPITMAKVGNFTLDSISYNSVTWVVSSQCKNPDAAVKFLNLTYTDPDIMNLLVWGIKDVDYVQLDNGQVKYPDGKSNSDVPYTCSVAAYYLGTQWLAHEVAGMPEGISEVLKANVKNSRVSNAMGFNFTPDAVANEIKAVVAVVDEYMPGFVTGTLDLDKEYEPFIKALYDAGLQSIIDAKQEQLDAWAVANGKK